ncbi:MAG: ATP-dependent sacrificial sulfur transferase LarE [Methanosarcinaceae archaeon]|nr:ATP-dependent sacrificial sulfur transferase LarE [Methanosarcinaceae archaeon]MDF1532892.1 ATP-dependent sacrificial sulfur transferase LarE [Methanosarcinaceae archaeon]
MQEKINQIKEAIAQKNSAIIAFSGGVDSATIAALAYEALGGRALAVTASSETFSERELKGAVQTAREIGIKHMIVNFDELEEPGFAENTQDRCYHCKKGLLHTLINIADEEGFNVVLEGTNASEIQGHRPGRQAIVEAGERVFTPFVDFGVTKDEVRQIAREIDLSVADKPSMACLSSRFPYGQLITRDGLTRVGAAEDFLFSLGFTQLRVRDHSDRSSIARIEIIPSEFDRFLQERERIVSHLKKLGFDYVTMDIEGFRSGSMDEVL